MAAQTFIFEILKTERFDGSNYSSWKRNIGYVLSKEELDEILIESRPHSPSNDSSQDTNDKYATWKRKNRRTRNILLCTMVDSYASKYESMRTAKEMHERLEREHVDPSLIKQSLAMKKYNELKMSESTKISYHVHTFLALIREVQVIGMQPKEPMQVVHLMNSLPNSWDTFITSVAVRSKAPKLEELITVLKGEEERRNARHTPASKETVYMKKFKPFFKPYKGKDKNVFKKKQ
ncbi:uncharacterized protein LOC105421235 [Amborella trichopoda]|uniref:uncharacterized protein LOC105421235 n=1 Tax=Amborella trichopoda TaxID=13333 RepID=UPI0005D3D367|nr:uncharacterized protein LOC105421235 [Amborella trichopoda]|eukprot:XP_011626133.1 uncharacterized protein LOC105421235 [Amborella trichopoda]